MGRDADAVLAHILERIKTIKLLHNILPAGEIFLVDLVGRLRVQHDDSDQANTGRERGECEWIMEKPPETGVACRFIFTRLARGTKDVVGKVARQQAGGVCLTVRPKARVVGWISVHVHKIV